MRVYAVFVLSVGGMTSQFLSFVVVSVLWSMGPFIFYSSMLFALLLGMAIILYLGFFNFDLSPIGN